MQEEKETINSKLKEKVGAYGLQSLTTIGRRVSQTRGKFQFDEGVDGC